MQDLSSYYKSLIAAGDYFHRAQLRLGAEQAAAGSLSTYEAAEIRSMTTSVSCFAGTLPSVGGVMKRKLSARIKPRSGEEIPRRAQLRPELALVRGTRATEWISKGVFYIERRVPSGSYLDLTAYDALYRADTKYPGSSLSWPAADIDVLREIAGAMGVQLDSRTEAIVTQRYRIPWPSGSTIADVLSGIAASYGGNFVMSDLEELLLVPVWALPEVEGELTEENDGAITFGDTNITVRTGRGSIPGWGAAQVGPHSRPMTAAPALGAWQRVELAVGNGDEDAVYTAEGEELTNGATLQAVCPWATQAMANHLLELVYGIRYQPYEAERAVLEPAAEIGDGVVIGRIYGGIYNQVLRFTDGATSDIEAPGAKEISSEYPRGSASERAFSREVGSLSAELRVAVDRIDQNVSDLTTAAENLRTDLTQTATNLAIAASQWEDDARALSARLDLQAKAIEAIVEDESPDGTNSLAMVMNLENGWAIVSNGTRVFEVAPDGTVHINGEQCFKLGNSFYAPQEIEIDGTRVTVLQKVTGS